MSDRPFPLHAGLATVAAAALETPSMRRLTLAAPAFAEPGIEQPGEIITLGWPEEGESELVLPQLGWRFPDAPEQHWRNFSVRASDPASGTLDVEFFLHGDSGRAGAWGTRAEVGDEVGFAGPRTHWVADPGAEWTLLLADETGLPALLAIAESLPAGHRALALVEVGDEGERRAVGSAAEVEWRWCSRGGRPPGTTTVLLDELRRTALPSGPGQAWGGGESLAMRDLRRHLAATCPAVAGRTRLLGYWLHDDSPEDADDEDED
jgi:NADPH-dependent ferric siderophore reductase